MVLVVTMGCYSPSFERCAVHCDTTADCAPGHVCTSAGLCASPDDSCEGSPGPDAAVDAPEVAGAYALLFTNRENGCDFPGWTVGAASTMTVTVTRNGAVVLAEPQGLAAGFLDLWLGAHVFAGEQTGNDVMLVLAGNKQASHGNCTYTYDAAFTAALTGENLAGDIYYRARTNGGSACGALTGCATHQAIQGTRTN